VKYIIQAQRPGIIGFTKSLAKELGPSNVKVNAIAPGIIDTDMNKELTEKDIEELKGEISLGRIGSPSEIANTAYMLIQNEYITGQVITIDGGWIDY